MPNFSYSTPVADLFPTVIAQAREAESAGFDTAFVMDHFYQLPGLGEPDEPMLEAYTALGALATATDNIQLSALVTGNTYRNPPMLAKAVTTLDVASGGRAVLGIGAGWFELEHQQYGYEFGTFTDRFERLDEALQIIAPMLHGQRPTFDGKWYHVENAINEPRIRDDLPIMLGGGGEKKTFGLAARFADHLNIICNASELPRKLEALDARCFGDRPRPVHPGDQLPGLRHHRRGRRPRPATPARLPARARRRPVEGVGRGTRRRHRPAVLWCARRGGRADQDAHPRPGHRWRRPQSRRQRARTRHRRTHRPHVATARRGLTPARNTRTTSAVVPGGSARG